ncbi:SRPBCC family protein [Sediminibacterium ginsengisoli]|uniref:Uncharacterized conserved protein YndB, AHSA1/START domain n=1 Tax=Sediminibacterium ginsengisoli TaxID=413434 RepID=A0A1T4R1P8_9BACT|nr:SRPBCC family protein [Sediminibacterium ginsengisoli]SKA09785.1 Uncharacterized conserved protein YndB, AHSA1/START domain [Sediminibacterium ginsengisoli]
MENSGRTQITVTTTVNAPVEKVWRCWNEPEHITKWCQASPDWHAPAASNDLRTGGNFTTTMAAKDGSFSFDFGGVYTDVQEHRLIAYTMGDGRMATVSFSANGDTTDIVETFEAESTNPEEMQKAGWQAILDSFKHYTEAV